VTNPTILERVKQKRKKNAKGILSESEKRTSEKYLSRCDRPADFSDSKHVVSTTFFDDGPAIRVGLSSQTFGIETVSLPFGIATWETTCCEFFNFSALKQSPP
jgi:hypothetical protein